MADNKERGKINIDSKESYVVVALRRVSKNKDENTGSSKMCFRFVQKDQDLSETIRIAKETIASQEGVWRIYRTVNKRSFEKARKQLMIDLITRPEQYEGSIDSHWKSILCTDACKSENKWLIDIDRKDEDLINSVKEFVLSHFGEIYETVDTPNGHHLITNRFDNRDFKNTFSEDVEIKKDALVFVEAVDLSVS